MINRFTRASEQVIFPKQDVGRNASAKPLLMDAATPQPHQ